MTPQIPDRLIRWGIGAVLGGILISSSSLHTIAEYERGVVTTFGAFSRVAAPGLTITAPFIQGMTIYRTDIQAFQVPNVNTYTIDNQEVDALITINFRVPGGSVDRIYRDVPDYRARLTTLAIDRFKAEMGKINVIDVAQKRGAVASHIRDILAGEAQRLLGLEIIDFQLTNIDYTKGFREAMDKAATAKALVEAAEQNKRQAEVDADRAKITAIGLANGEREKARGAADAQLLLANAQAESIRLKGEAEAKAILAQSNALSTQGTSLIELRKAERWDGALPRQMMGGAIPLLNFQMRDEK